MCIYFNNDFKLQSKDLGSNPSEVESVFFSTERFSNSLNIIEMSVESAF